MDEFLKWLAEIRGITPEKDSTLRFEFAALPEGGIGLLILVGVLLGFLFIGAIYRKDAARISTGGKVLLASLRCAAVISVLFVFLEPSLVVVKKEVRPGHAILLIDKSRSMGHRDGYQKSEALKSAWEKLGMQDVPAATRMELVKKLLSVGDAEVIAKLAAKNQLFVYTFDGAITPAPVVPEPEPPPGAAVPPAVPPAVSEGQEAPAKTPKLDLQRLEADGARTNLSEAIRSALERSRNANIAAIVILSDGRRNTGMRADEAGRALRQRKVEQVLVVGIGDPQETQTVQIAEMEAPERAFQKDPFAIKARLVSSGYDSVTLTVSLKEVPVGGTEGRVLETRQVTLSTTAPESLQEFPNVTATAPGKVDYRLEIDPPPGEPRDDVRHQKQQRVEILSEQMRVLLIAGGPSFEFQILRNLLIRDKTIDVSCWLESADPEFPQDGDTVIKELPAERKDLDVYDVVILLDPDPGRLSGAFAEMLARQVVEQGTGLLYVAGEKFTYPSCVVGSPLAPIIDLLPVTPDADKAKFEHGFGKIFARPWSFELTPDGKAHKIMRLIPQAEANEVLWSRLPGHHWSFRVARPKPAAQVLAGHSDPTRRVGGEPEPVMATHFIGAGRVFYSGTDETYRWRSIAEKEYNQYWIKAIRYLYEGRISGGSSRFQILVDEPVFDIGEEVKIVVRAKNERLEPLDAREVRVRARSSRGDDVLLTLQAVASKPGSFEGTFRPAHEGSWELTQETGGEAAPSASALFRVVPSEIESEGPMDLQELSDLAAAAGGRVLAPDELIPALDQVRSHEARQTIRVPHSVWDSWFTLGIACALLALEWILRKRMNLL